LNFYCRNWRIEPCPYQYQNGCPLDNISNAWKQKHHPSAGNKGRVLRVPNNPPTIDGCERWIRAKMEELDFEQFEKDFRKANPDVSLDATELRRCWTAHLVVDYATDYWEYVMLPDIAQRNWGLSWSG
jgi:hypothetical protein